MCLDFHPDHPNFIATGFYDGKWQTQFSFHQSQPNVTDNPTWRSTVSAKKKRDAKIFCGNKSDLTPQYKEIQTASCNGRFT